MAGELKNRKQPDTRQSLLLLRRVLLLSLVSALGFTLAARAWYWWAIQPPPLPREEQRVLFQGISYQREVLRSPRPLIIHTVRIDLRARGISFLVTPPSSMGTLPLKARTVSQFCSEFGVQLAVNGDFFSPWYSRSPWHYYPHPGDPVQVDGMAASRGQIYSRGSSRSPVLTISPDNRAEIFESPQQAREQLGPANIFNAISGHALLVQNGRAVSAARWFKDHGDLHPRVALGLDKSKKSLHIVVIDGRQSGYSEGVSMKEFALLLAKKKIDVAIDMDGGGSATLVRNGVRGKPEVLSSPIDNRIPGREGPVANHLGVFARR